MKIASNKYYIQYTGTTVFPQSIATVNAVQIELLKYNLEISSELKEAISRNTPNKAIEFCSALLKDYTVGKLDKPFFQNWEDRTEFKFEERIVQIFGYIFGVSGNDLEDPSYMDQILSLVKPESPREVIELAFENEAKQTFYDLVKSRVSLDRKQLSVLVGLSKYFATADAPRIYSDEARISVLMSLASEPQSNLYDLLVKLNCKPSDVLRYSAALVDITKVNLPSDVIYGKLTWFERICLLKFLDKFDTEELFEAVGQNREVWTRFYKHIHLFNQKDFINRFKNIGLVARISMGFKEEVIPRQYFTTLDKFLETGVVESTESENLVYRTFASRIKTAIENKDFEKILKLVEKNGDYLLRNLATVSNGVAKKDEINFINLVRGKLSKASVGVLFSILGINVNSQYRIIDVKGNTVVETSNYPKFISDIQGDIRRELNSRYGFDGKVIVEENLKQKVVPFLSKNSELDRGSRIKLDNGKYLYMFMKWIQSKHTRTDLDLSVMAFDENWNSTIVYFGYQANSFISHSGDITNAPAPNGATEYIKIDLTKIPKNIKYILPIINVFTGDVFDKNEEAYAGFMVSTSDKFSINKEHIRYDLTEPANSNVPFLLDVESGEIVILDFNNRIRSGFTAYSEVDNMKKLILAAMDKTVVTIDMVANILSGNSDVVSLTVKSVADKTLKEIEPNDLSKIFNQ